MAKTLSIDDFKNLTPEELETLIDGARRWLADDPALLPGLDDDISSNDTNTTESDSTGTTDA